MAKLFAAQLGPLFVHARDALLIVEAASGRIVLWNPAAELVFGYPANEAIGQLVDILMPPAVARLQRERMAHYARTGDADILAARHSQALTAITRQGDEIHIELTLAPLEALDARTSGGGVRHVLVTCRDSSQEKQAELQALSEASRAEQERAQTEARLHQYEHVLREGTRELAWSLGRARRAAARLSRMAPNGGTGGNPGRLALMARVVEARTAAVQRTIEQIDDVASIQAGRFEMDAQRINLVPLVGQVIARVRGRSTAHRLNLAAPQGLSAFCDGGRVAQVLEVLIDQAFKRNPRGCWIDVDLRRPLAGVANIEVRDYGRPLTNAERERMPGGPTTDREWYLCDHIVQEHGGTLSIEFPSEGGVRVNVMLPTHGGRVNRAM